MSQILPFGLAFKNSLDKHVVFQTLLDEISKILMDIPEYMKLKNEPEFLLLICRLIECKYPSNTSKIDKADLAVNIYGRLFGSLNDADKTNLTSQIQFLYDNGKIKKTSWAKLAMFYVTDWIKRKLG